MVEHQLISATYQQEVKGFLKTISPYFPKGSIPKDDVPEPQTPTSATTPPTSPLSFLLPNKLEFGNSETSTPPRSLLFLFILVKEGSQKYSVMKIIMIP